MEEEEQIRRGVVRRSEEERIRCSAVWCRCYAVQDGINCAIAPILLLYVGGRHP